MSDEKVRPMLKCLGWLSLHYFKLTRDSRSDSARGFSDGLKRIPLTEEKGEEVLASEFSAFVPCLNGCIGLTPMGANGNARAQ
jgi:hypothetical protein